jgi:hypothetical protein
MAMKGWIRIEDEETGEDYRLISTANGGVMVTHGRDEYLGSIPPSETEDPEDLCAALHALLAGDEEN